MTSTFINFEDAFRYFEYEFSRREFKVIFANTTVPSELPEGNELAPYNNHYTSKFLSTCEDVFEIIRKNHNVARDGIGFTSQEYHYSDEPNKFRVITYNDSISFSDGYYTTRFYIHNN
jgi:hypothetical protein